MRAVATAWLLTGCLSQHIGPAVMRTDWQHPSRDPDPLAPLVDDEPPNPFVPEAEQPAPGSPRARGARAAATLAAVLAGAIPAIVWYGTFDESRWFGERPARAPAATPHRRAEQVE